MENKNTEITLDKIKTDFEKQPIKKEHFTLMDTIAMSFFAKQKLKKKATDRNASQLILPLFTDGNITLSIEQYNQNITASTQQTLMYLMQKITTESRGQITINIRDYMQTIKLTDYDTAREKLKRDLNNLWNNHISFKNVTYYDNKGKKRIGNGAFRLIGAIKTDRYSNNIMIETSNLFNHLAQFGKQLKFNDYYYSSKKPLNRALSLMIDKWKQNRQNRIKKIMKINVLQALKYTNLPSYDEVIKSTNRHVNKRIIEPFQNALNELVTDRNNEIEKWEYCKAGTDGEVLKHKDYENFTWNQFKTLYICFYFKNNAEKR